MNNAARVFMIVTDQISEQWKKKLRKDRNSHGNYTIWLHIQGESKRVKIP